MKDKIIYGILIGLLGIFFTVLFSPGAYAKSRFERYIHSSFYERAIKQAASHYVLARIENCTTRRTVFVRKHYDLLEPVIFKKKKSHPVEGLWIERVTILTCGKSYNLDISVVSKESGEQPKFDVSVSGNN
ncbi:MAG: hypothetical protein ACLFR0_04470 [Alphaproteobacteria bacterium]